MKLTHQIETTVFSYSNENFEAILTSFLGLFPFNIEEEKIKLERSSAAGFNNKGIIVLRIKLQKESHTTKFIQRIFSILGDEEKNKLSRQLETSLDDELNFFMRFEKDEWVENRKLKLTDSGRCFHIKISLAAFPKNRKSAAAIIRKLLE